MENYPNSKFLVLPFVKGDLLYTYFVQLITSYCQFLESMRYIDKYMNIIIIARLSPFAPALVSLLLSAMAPMTTSGYQQEFLVEDWQPHAEDRLLVDTQKNVGYLIHPTGEFLQFPVVTGQNKYVYYIGRYYKATTPEGEWTVKSRHIKADRMTFGPSGRFLRLYKDGETYTPYGIHEYGNESEMFLSEGRFGSMGCVIVTEEIMDIIDETYTLTNGTLEVVTKYGLHQTDLKI